MTDDDASFPETPAGPFERPPRSITDEEDRTIELSIADVDGADREAVIAMYERFDSADRAQGIPPVDREAIERWLDRLTCGDCLNVIATHENHVIGHAMAVPDEKSTPETIDAYELAIFVEKGYQGAGVGTELTHALLGEVAAAGVEYVWLTVERWNDPAVAVYQTAGFEVIDSSSFELEMAIRLET